MIRKILPILFTSLVGFSANNNFSYTPDYSYNYSFIDYESPAYRLGDYEITELVHINAGGGQVRYNRIQAIIPCVVFDTLGQYDNVYIAIPLYDYNSAVNLDMRIDYYVDGELNYPVIYGLENIPLSMTMLKVLPYTMVDLANNFNVFDTYYWESGYGQEIRITFTVPFTAHTNPPSDYSQQLRNITLFTKRSDSAGYFDGYETGYNDGYENGNADGYADGYADGSADSYLDGYNDGYKWGDIDGYNRGINENFNAYSYLFGMFGAFSGLFAVELLPGLTIGGIAILVLSLTLLPFLIGLFTKGGKK
jgi:hypothetical protein